MSQRVGTTASGESFTYPGVTAETTLTEISCSNDENKRDLSSCHDDTDCSCSGESDINNPPEMRRAMLINCVCGTVTTLLVIALGFEGYLMAQPLISIYCWWIRNTRSSSSRVVPPRKLLYDSARKGWCNANEWEQTLNRIMNQYSWELLLSFILSYLISKLITLIPRPYLILSHNFSSSHSCMILFYYYTLKWILCRSYWHWLTPGHYWSFGV